MFSNHIWDAHTTAVDSHETVALPRFAKENFNKLFKYILKHYIQTEVYDSLNIKVLCP